MSPPLPLSPSPHLPLSLLPTLKIMVKDKISLIAAAAGGFMLFVSLSAILQGAPVTALQAQDSFDSIKVTDLQLQKVHLDDFKFQSY